MDCTACICVLLLLLVGGCGDCHDEPETGQRAVLEDPIDIERYATELGLAGSFKNDLGLRFTLVAGGSFEMGSPTSDGGHHADEALHRVTIHNPYYVQTTVVPVHVWRQFAGADATVDRITHEEATAFAVWLTARSDGRIYRLPTEAEWEFAAASRTADIGTRSGNGEWCADWYAPHPPQSTADPVGPYRGTERVVRGQGRRTATRGHAPPETRDGIAVRLVAEAGYAGRIQVTFVAVERDPEGRVVREVAGLPLRLITVIDRLSDRQAGLIEEWKDLEGRTPLALRLRPGRYYAYAWRKGEGEEIQGHEQKFDVDEGPHVVQVDVPGGE